MKYRLKKDTPNIKAGTEGSSLGPCTWHGVPGIFFFAKGTGASMFFLAAFQNEWLEKIV